jgi:hypothetical protein
MRHSRTWIIALLLIAVAALAGPVAGASASAGSIKAVFKHYASKIDIAEGHVLTAAGNYETEHLAAPVEMAIAESAAVLSSLRSKIAVQPAGGPRVRKAKRLIVKGLGVLIGAYGMLKTAFAEKAADPEAAKVEAAAAEMRVAAGRSQLLAGTKLIS